jgi:excisionase family DNA binding protein
MSDDLMKIPDAAAFLGCSEIFLYRLTSRGLIQHYRVGRTIRFSRTQLEAYLAAGEVKPGLALAAAR